MKKNTSLIKIQFKKLLKLKKYYFNNKLKIPFNILIYFKYFLIFLTKYNKNKKYHFN